MAARQTSFPTIDFQNVEILDFLGEGSLGGVWKIKDELGHPKAMKVIYKLPESEQDDFLGKLALLKEMNHRYLVSMERVGKLSFASEPQILARLALHSEVSSFPFVIMPLADKNLEQIFQESKQDFSFYLYLALQVCFALRRIHHFQVYNEQGEIENFSHGHLTTNNILLFAYDNTYRLKVSDLGVDTQFHLSGTHATGNPHACHFMNDFQSVEGIVKRLLRSYPQELAKEGITEIQIGDLPQLEAFIAKIKAIKRKRYTQKTARRALQLAISLYHQGLYSYALQDIDQALALDQNLPEAYLYQGKILHKQAKVTQAHQAYQKALALDASYLPAYESEGNLYAEEKKYQQAIDYFQQALGKDPARPACYDGLAMVYWSLGEAEKALDNFSRLLELDPEFVPAYLDRGDIFFAQQAYHKALADYQEALRLSKENQQQQEEIQERISQTQAKLH